MSSTACTNIKYKFYSGVWSDWQSTLTGGYAGNNKYVVVLKFKTPAIDKPYTSTSLSFSIPYVRQSNAATEGTIYVKLYSSDPTDQTAICDIPNSNTCDDSDTWNTNDQQVHIAKFKITEKLSEDKTYYLVIGSSASQISIGYSGYDDDYSIDFNYTIYTNGTSPSIVMKDNGNNTVTISGALGKNGDHNTIKSAMLYYTFDGTDPSSSDTRESTSLTAGTGESYSKKITITKKCTVKAYVKKTFQMSKRIQNIRVSHAAFDRL